MEISSFTLKWKISKGLSGKGKDNGKWGEDFEKVFEQ
jgi:hypothetical protein